MPDATFNAELADSSGAADNAVFGAPPVFPESPSGSITAYDTTITTTQDQSWTPATAAATAVANDADVPDQYQITWLSMTPPLPTFSITVMPYNVDGVACTVEIQTADNYGFSVNVATTTLVAQPSGVAFATTIGPFPYGATKYIRVRSGNSPVWSNYTDIVSVLIPTVAGAASEYVLENVGVHLALQVNSAEYVLENVGVHLQPNGITEEFGHYGDVNTTQPEPRIWTVFPESGRPGDGVTLWGLGFGSSQAAYTGVVEMYIASAWTPVSIVSWSRVAANSDAYGVNRAIEPFIPNIDVEHEEIEITIPAQAVPLGHNIHVRTTVV